MANHIFTRYNTYMYIILNHTSTTMALYSILLIATVTIAGKCIAAKIAIILRKAGHIKGPKEGHTEISSLFDCISDNLDHCAAEQER